MSKRSKLLPPGLILITVLLSYVNDKLFYGAAVISTLLTLFLFFLSFRRSTPPRPKYHLLLPLAFLLGLFGTVAAAPRVGTVFAILGSFLLYQFYRFSARTVPLNVERTFSLFTAFLFSVFVWSVNYYFTPEWWTIVILAASGFFAIFLFKQQPLGVWVGTLIMSEVVWALLFWPVHFFTAGTAAFGVFYLCYLLADLHFHRKLSRRMVYFQVSLISFVVLITLVSSSWQPINRI